MDVGQITTGLQVDTVMMHTPGWFVVLAEEIEALVWHWHPALIWVNCAEREVLRSSLALGQHVKKGGFPVVDRVRSIKESSALIHTLTKHTCQHEHTQH